MQMYVVAWVTWPQVIKLGLIPERNLDGRPVAETMYYNSKEYTETIYWSTLTTFCKYTRWHITYIKGDQREKGTNTVGNKGASSSLLKGGIREVSKGEWNILKLDD